MCFCNLFTLENISNFISILTPIILLCWFYYSQKSALSRKYYDELVGIYAGLTKPFHPKTEHTGVMAGVILNIREVYSSGYFKGEFDYGEMESSRVNEAIVKKPIRTGVHSFYGEIDFKIYLDEKRHPFMPNRNRTYIGKLYVVDRLDFQFENYQIDDYLAAEYEIFHHREMQTLSFKLIRQIRVNDSPLPQKMILYKSAGLSFEPYNSVKHSVFEKTFSDRNNKNYS